jgi:hypothetical protein
MNSLTSWATISFSTRPLWHEVTVSLWYPPSENLILFLTWLLKNLTTYLLHRLQSVKWEENWNWEGNGCSQPFARRDWMKPRKVSVTMQKFIYETVRNAVTATTAQSVERLGYRLDDRGSRVRFPAGAGNFSLHHRVQTGSGAHPAPYPMGTGGFFAGGKAARTWSWPLTSI